jgi:[acyl-carrier-protein] S-malonyltransferase
VANVSAEPVETGPRARELLVSQLTGAVRWSDGILQIAQLGISSFMEIGPGSVLTGLLRRIDKGLQGRAVGDLEALRALAAE